MMRDSSRLRSPRRQHTPSRLTWLLLHACARPIEAGENGILPGIGQAPLRPVSFLVGIGQGEEPQPAWKNPK